MVMAGGEGEGDGGSGAEEAGTRAGYGKNGYLCRDKGYRCISGYNGLTVLAA